MKIRQLINIVDEGTRCWKGYEKKGMKTMFGKRVPNCVKKEHVDYCVNCGDLVFSEEVNEDLRKWFKDKWVRFGPDGKVRGQCARGSKSEGKPKCLPSSKAYSMSKKERAKSASRKRREDPNKNRSGKAKNVATQEIIMENKCEKCGHDSHCNKECKDCVNDVCTGCRCNECK